MSALNKIFCATSNSNTGTPKCSFDFKLVEGGMLIPKGTKFTETQVKVLNTTLQALAVYSTEAGRGYPLQDISAVEEKGEDVQLSTSTSGVVAKGRNAKLHLVMEYVMGGMNRENLLNTFDQAQGAYDYLVFDTVANAVIGTKPDTNTSGYVLQGFALDLIYFPKFKLDPGGTKHYIGLVFSDYEEMSKRLAYYVLPDGQRIKNIKGLSNLELNVYQTISSAVAKIAIETDYGAQDLYATYGSALQALTWTANADLAGTSITVAVALDATTKTLQFTFSGSGYTAMASGETLTLYTPTISAMSSTVPLFANNSIQLTKP